MDRRSLLLTLPALGLAAPSWAAAPKSLKGIATPSTSVQISASSDDALTGFVMRICQYPEHQVTWVWSNFFHRGRIWTYTDDQLRQTHPTPNIETGDVRYLQRDGAEIDLWRKGPRSQPQAAGVEARLMTKAGGRVSHGRGNTPVLLKAQIAPSTAKEGMLPDRSEAKGLVTGVMTIAGRRVPIRGFGSWHEQPQSRARFVDPFVYFRGSGDGIAFTFSQYPGEDAGGYLTTGGTTDPIKRFKITPPGPVRRFRATLASGRELTGEVRRVYDFGIRIYDGWRVSAIVTGQLDGKPYVGAINDFMGEKISYLQA